MASSILSALAAISAVSATDLFYADETGAGLDRKVTAAQIKTFCSASPTLVTPALGTPSSGTLTNCTLPIGGVTGLGTGVATFLATPSSANLLAAVTDETGSGALVFANTPTLVTPALGVATGTSIALNGATLGSNKLAVTGDAQITGAFNVTGTGSVSSGFTVGNSGYLGWSSRALFLSPAANIVKVTDNTTTAGAGVQLIEMTAPSAPATNNCILFAQDNGGKTELMVLFPTGTAQQIKIEA